MVRALIQKFCCQKPMDYGNFKVKASRRKEIVRIRVSPCQSPSTEEKQEKSEADFLENVRSLTGLREKPQTTEAIATFLPLLSAGKQKLCHEQSPAPESLLT